MKSLLQFWNNQFRFDRPLESDSWVRDKLNRHLVGTLLNTFPHAATRLFARSRGELARRVCVDFEGGSYRVFHAMYEYEKPHARGDLLNQLLMESPAAKAARNRRKIAQAMLARCLLAAPADKPQLVLAIGGGDGTLEVEAIARCGRPNVFYCVVDKDEKAVADNPTVMQRHGLEGKGMVFIGDASEKRDLQAVVKEATSKFATPFEGVSVAVCHGITEYLDMGVPGNEILHRLLRAIHDCAHPGGSLIISQTDYHDRVRFVERGLRWTMRLRSMEELEAEIERAGWQISLCDHEPMQLISLALAMKSSESLRRVDSPSRLRRPRTISASVAPATSRR